MRRPEFIARQSGRPSGWLGAIIGRMMARETAHANRIALDLLELEADDCLLDVGCGHGAALARAATVVTAGFLAGIDHSEVMLRIAKRGSAQLIATGRLELRRADSRRFPHLDGRFNKVCAVHTVYFWSDPEAHLREIFRVLSPAGRLVLGYHPLDDAGFARDFPSSVYAIRSAAEIETILRRCGFQQVRTKINDDADGRMAWTVAQKSPR